jgi:DNA modification methylase
MVTRLLVGDCREVLPTLADQSVHCCVTSPPYFGLRDYNVTGQIGLEASLDAYITTLVEVFREVRRVLRDDGTCWLNLGDSYANLNHAPGSTAKKNGKQGWGEIKPNSANIPTGLKPKDLMMVPARVALALQADGWYLRSDIIWAKKACMPESVTDRPTSAHEHVFLLTKKAKYYFDMEAVREQSERPELIGKMRLSGVNGLIGQRNDVGRQHDYCNPAGRNLRNVWHLGPSPFPEAHFATFPPALVEPCIKAGTSERGCCAACGAPWGRVVERSTAIPARNGTWKSTGENHRNDLERKGGFYDQESQTLGWRPSCSCNADAIPCTVLDPFAGSGTTGLVAERLGRDSILIELNPAYAAMSRDRISNDAPLFTTVLL